jgi:hypothetical protein
LRYSTFEQAAVEASSGVKEIDGEIQRLKAKRDLLDTLARQLMAVLPALAEALPADTGNHADASHENSAAAQPQLADGSENGQSSWNHSEETPAYANSASDAPATEEPSFAELLAQSKPYSLRNEGWPATAPADQRGIRQIL